MKLDEFSRAWAAKKPRSLCSCGHTGDGAYSDHRERYQAGHGACKVAGCTCVSFTWQGWTLPFQEALRAAKL